MTCVTAENTASIRFCSFNAPMAFASIPEQSQLYKTLDAQAAEYYRAFRQQLSDTKQENALLEVQSPSAKWFNKVQQRIQNSIAPGGRNVANDTRWISQNIADAANRFFKATSDVLPSEPYIYSSRKGDLVAEFLGVNGRMTSIISETSVIAFAVVHGTPVERQLSLGKNQLNALRQEFQHLTEMLRTGHHGTEVESKG